MRSGLGQFVVCALCVCVRVCVSRHVCTRVCVCAYVNACLKASTAFTCFFYLMPSSEASNRSVKLCVCVCVAPSFASHTHTHMQTLANEHQLPRAIDALTQL